MILDKFTESHLSKRKILVGDCYFIKVNNQLNTAIILQKFNNLYLMKNLETNRTLKKLRRKSDFWVRSRCHFSYMKQIINEINKT